MSTGISPRLADWQVPGADPPAGSVFYLLNGPLEPLAQLWAAAGAKIPGRSQEPVPGAGEDRLSPNPSL